MIRTIRKLGQRRPPCKGALYTIKAGDTFFSIAQEALLPVEVIQAANPGVNPNNLRIGSQICIPGFPVPPCPNGYIWVVEKGETFYSIAQQTNTTTQAIARANPGVNPNNLQLGTRLCIPWS